MAIKSYIVSRTRFLASLALFFSLIAWLGSVAYYFELASHFRLHYLLLAILCAVIFVWAGRWKWVVVSLLAAGLNLPALMPAYLPASQPADTKASLRIVMANVHTENSDYADFITWAGRQRPDIIIVIEATPEWAKALAPLQAYYPHKITLQRRDPFGLLVFSKVAFEKQQVLGFGNGQHPSLFLRVKKSGRELGIVATHTEPPVDSELFALRNRELDNAAEVVARIKGARILIGDLNTTQWSPYFVAMKERGGLRDGRNGFGILPTWPAELPGLMIPIDQLLVSSEVAVRKLSVGDDIGSDHLPIFAEVRF